MLDVARILLPFAPALDAPQPRGPIVLREAMTPVLAAFPVFERVQNLSLDLPKLTVASSLQFAPASASLDDASRTTLDSIAEQLEDSKSRQVRLLVSLRSGDDPDAARRLALARMLVVRAYLLSRGIAASRLDARATVAAGNDEVARIALFD
jgi:outer membrane protein OmpA-like peptidoglycan-associated protein